MKFVPSLQAEPGELAEYRQTYPEDAQADGFQASAVWSRFRDSSAYSELRTRLLERQQGLCAYCEQRLSDLTGLLLKTDQQIEHYLAKSGGPGRTLDWKNLLLCCCGGTNRYSKDDSRQHYDGGESCGQSKGDLDLGDIDPRRFPLSPSLVKIGIDGLIYPEEDACRGQGVDPENLEAAIRILNLNGERLRRARERTAEELDQWFNAIISDLLANSNLDSQQKTFLQELHVAGRLQPDTFGHLHRFWSVERQYVEALSPGWVDKNRELFFAS